mmetsp:Transcript_26850/g.45292  ORF Transcript_26850/g.45292 Transcript_26850/m.45292 type:complete len:602 (+) Transcript_26850:80-1885(+)
MSTPGMKALSSSESLSSMSTMSRREEVRRMRENRLREKEVNLTFKPTIKKSASNLSLASDSPSVSNESCFEKLYGEAKKRKDTERKGVNYSFQPTTNSKGKRRSSTPEGTSKRLYEAPGAGKPRRSSSVDKSKDRSFSPQITSRGRSVERQGSLSSPATRLYSQAQTQRQSREALATKISQETSKECTFSPKTNSDAKSPPSSGVTMAQRMEKYVAIREKRMADLKEKQLQQEAEKATFKPTSFTRGRSRSAERRRSPVSPTAEKTSPDKTPSASAGATVFDRLANATPNKKPVVFEDKEIKELTFKPSLVSKRAPSPARQEEASKYGNVHNRLYQKGNEQRAETQLKKDQIRKEMEKEHTFAPAVPSNHKSNPDSPTKEAVFERLSASRQYVHEILSQVKTEFELDNCTFRPEINKVSDEISVKKHSEPAYLRLSAEAKRIREEKEKRQAKKKEEELVDCTFSPHIDKKSTKVITSKRANTKGSVFDRLSTAPTNGVSSPPVQENTPVNVPRVIRKSTLDKLCQSKGVVGELGSPSKKKGPSSPNSLAKEMAAAQQEEQNEEGEVVKKLVPISPVAFAEKTPPEVSEQFFDSEEHVGSEY